ncbi:hypothetical protein [Hymenobacter sp. YC55]|uniref:hypothetical protein n=1 Tax=Hymenobacter sp. YC55 TaxID=3034019 RepID=UPI0023F83E5B|nr:hypothetical protein [Hymenobacter sp. YC55]MDF7810307.1 hypothetical protein [Hymenobacter sp. YC55]
MLDQTFCEHLEWQIGGALQLLWQTDERLKGFWCDGVLPPDIDSEYSKKQVHDKRCVVTKAFAGKTGQGEYKLTLLFGRKTLSRYTRNLRLEECVPNAENSDWLEVDPVMNTMVVQLL